MSNDRMHDLDASNKALWAEVKAVRAENDRLRAELAELRASRRWEYIEALEDRAEKAEAAIARVRELLPATDRHGGYVLAADVRRALDGE